MEEKIQTLALSVVVACGLTVVACGSSNTSPTQPSTAPLTQAQITSLETTFATVENTVAPQVLPQVFSEGTDSSGTSLPVNVSEPCPDAGTAGVTGTVNLVSSSGTKDTVGANLTITFSKCMSGGVELDGALSGVGQLNLDTSTTNIIVNPVT